MNEWNESEVENDHTHLLDIKNNWSRITPKAYRIKDWSFCRKLAILGIGWLGQRKHHYTMIGWCDHFEKVGAKRKYHDMHDLLLVRGLPTIVTKIIEKVSAIETG